ncbi:MULTISPECIES: PLP-dependent cysteine synthase family protein [Bradyrhizobium]|uniref:PLP-dependent cysteine synthase family protein n=1 Tax=Bradyrhizobium TaxID=374 RepID=UPI001BA49A3B|nr:MULTISPECIES: cysteine synthase family protein [Bradyrhizobium]MBR0947962.1 cysteine synthase family protein [Bradyrhizobium liaoningense]MDI2077435.1 cysteine synthase family protein [Bradyrhizobium sp. Mp27]
MAPKFAIDVESAIGNTPMLKIRGLDDNMAEVYLKLEQFNPGGSIKDRIARTMIREAERRGDLGAGTTIVESSSGNTAIGLAMLGTLKGYPTYAICDRNVPVAKLCRIQALGGKIIYLPRTPPGFDSVELRIALAEHLAKTVPGCITTAQFSNPDNPKAHYESTGPEIWEQMDHRISAVVAAVGTCGTISGIGRFLKERDPAIQIVAAEPVGSTIFGGERGNFLIQGGGLSFTPPNLDSHVVDDSHRVSDADAIDAIHWLARSNGMMVGGTAGWVVHTLLNLARHSFGPKDRLVGVLPDGADRYIDSLYEPRWLAANRFCLTPAHSRTEQDPLLEPALSFGCTVGGWDEAVSSDIRILYRELGLTVPEQQLAQT